MTNLIPHNKPCLDRIDALAAHDTVLSGWVAYGEISHRLENSIGNLILGENDRCLVCSSGTSALYLALNALEIRAGDEVILPDYVCTAVLNAIMMIGAQPIVVDIDQDTISLTADIIRPHITDRTAAIIAAHTYGIPCELDDIIKLDIPVIEDCAQALGSIFADGSPVGSKGNLSIFSFYATKSLTGGYGGAVISKKESLIKNVHDYINFDCPDYYKPRFNFQLSDINAAVIESQLKKLDRFLSRRKMIARLYIDAIGNPDYLRNVVNRGRFNHFRFLLNFSLEKELLDFKKYLHEKNIDAIIPLENYELLHNYLKLDRAPYPVSEIISRTILSLPIYPCLGDDDLEYIANCLREWRF